MFLTLPIGNSCSHHQSRWRRLLELNAEEYLATFNQLLIYRALKLLYGPPDVVSALINREEKSAVPIDWSFSLVLSDQVVCEVRRKHSSRVHFVVWAPDFKAPKVAKRSSSKSQTSARSLTPSFCKMGIFGTRPAIFSLPIRELRSRTLPRRSTPRRRATP